MTEQDFSTPPPDQKSAPEFQPQPNWRRRRRVSLLAASVLTTAACSAGPSSTEAAASSEEGCEPFMVIAQESFADYGVSVKAEPSVDSERLGGLLGDTPIPVDGWVETEPAYPDNPDPWKGEYWYRVADSAAAEGGNGLWLNSAGLRGEETDPLSGEDAVDNSKPADRPQACELEPADQ